MLEGDVSQTFFDRGQITLFRTWGWMDGGGEPNTIIIEMWHYKSVLTHIY